MEEITITLGVGAKESRTETSGFKGGACKDAVRIFSKVLGDVSESKNKAEFYESEGCNRQLEVE